MTLYYLSNSHKRKTDWLFEPHKPLAEAPEVVGGGAPCCVPTWVESAKNNTVLKKIEQNLWKC